MAPRTTTLRQRLVEVRAFIRMFPRWFQGELWVEFFEGVRDGMTAERAEQAASNVIPFPGPPPLFLSERRSVGGRA